MTEDTTNYEQRIADAIADGLADMLDVPRSRSNPDGSITIEGAWSTPLPRRCDRHPLGCKGMAEGDSDFCETHNRLMSYNAGAEFAANN